MKGGKNVKNFCQAGSRGTLHTHTHTHTHTGNLLIAFLSTMFVVSGAFATDIPSSASTADCKNNPLDTYSGTSNLQADWEANEIALHWYSDGEELDDIPTESQSCIYDSTLTPPSAPTKTGYTFKGWRVRPPVCSLSGLDPSIGTSYDATHMRWKPISSTGTTMADEFRTENSSDLNSGEWAVTFNYGTVKGIAKCSNTSGGTPSDTDGRYCWCSATNYTPNGGNQCNVASPSWVFRSAYGSADLCARTCAYNCAFGVRSYDFFRRGVFGVQ